MDSWASLSPSVKDMSVMYHACSSMRLPVRRQAARGSQVCVQPLAELMKSIRFESPRGLRVPEGRIWPHIRR